MQYAITLDRRPATIEPISAAILAEDPAASVDLHGLDLRVSTTLASEPLLLAVRAADCSIVPVHLRLLPSECCGGCGG